MTSRALGVNVLNPAMDAVAVNHDQFTDARLIVAELANAHQTIDRLADLVIDLAAANGIELQCEHTITGWADEITRHLHDVERNGTDGAPSGRALAKQLIPLLDALADPLGLEQHPPARKRLHELFASVPGPQIFRPAVLYHVGARRRRGLELAHKTWQAQR